MKKLLAIVTAAVLIVTTVICTFALTGSSSSTSAKAYNVTLLPEIYQTIEGWGVFPCSVPQPTEDWWSGAYAVHEALFDDLGINFYRVELKGDCGDADGNLIETYMNMFRQSIQIAKDHGQEDYLLTIWTPPAGMKTNNSISGKNFDGSPATLVPAYEQTFCNYIVNVLDDLKEKGLPLPMAFSIQNEPNNAFDYQSCYYQMAQYKRVTKMMRATLDAAGYSEIMLAGAEGPQYRDNLLWFGEGHSELVKDSEYEQALDILAVHSYCNRLTTTKEDIDKYIAGIAQFPDKQIWQTEFSTIHSGASSTEIDRAIDGMRVFSKDVGWVGSNAWFWWLGWGDRRYSIEDSVQECLVDGKGAASAATEAEKGILYQAFAQVWNNAPVGSQVMRLETDDPSVVNTSEPESDMVAFLSKDASGGDRNVVLFMNPTNEDKVYNFNGLNGLSAEVYTAVSSEGGLELLRNGNMSGGTLANVKIPARSINVIVTQSVDEAAPSITYKKDPSVAIDENGVYVSRTQELDVKIQSDEPATVIFDGKPEELDSELSFTTKISLSTEPKEFTVIATDDAGNSATASYTFRYDPDYVRLVLEEEHTSTNQATVNINGRVNVMSTVTIDGDDGFTDTINTTKDLDFVYELSLQHGKNTFTLTAKDQLGNESEPVTLTVMCDLEVPEITINNTDFVSDDFEYIFSGTVSKNITSLLVNGQELITKVKDDLSFDLKLTLENEGDNEIVFQAIDASGNAGTLKKTVTFTRTGNTPSLKNGAAQVLRAAKPVVIDGVLDDEDWVIDIKVNKAIAGIPNNIVNFGALWDDEYLYVGVRVYDKHLFFDEPRVYINDGIELFLNPSNSKSGTYIAPYDKQIFIGFMNGDTNNLYDNGSGYQTGWSFIDGGYTCEIAIPWDSMGITPKSGLEIGFDLQNDDKERAGTGAATRESQIVWHGTADNWQYTSKFGTLTLAEPIYEIGIGEPQPGGIGLTSDVSVSGGNPLGKYLVVQYREGTGVDAKTTVLVVDAVRTVTLSYKANETITDVWLTDGVPDLAGELTGVRILTSASSLNKMN